jgi:transglutaminase-like putative cysteine protease
MIVVRSGEIIWEHDLNKFEQQSSAEISLPNPELPQDYLRKIHLLKIPYNKASKDSIHFVTVPSESTDTNPRLYSITHESIYEYDSPIYSSKHLFRLQPENDLSQSLLQYRLSVFADKQPVSCLATNFVGAFGNSATFIEVEQVYKLLEVICHSVVSVSTPAPKRFDLLHLTSNIPLIWMPWDRIMMQAYLIPPELPESELRELSDYALSFVKRNNHDVYAVLTDINRTIYQDYTYVSGSSNLHTTPYETYATHRGVCQDFANLFICLARLLNIPSRYRTGYVYTANDYDNQDQGDASHAWLEVYLPYVGWLGFDPTNQCMAEKNHIRVACGRNYSDAAPTSGTIFRGGGKEKLTINVRVLLLDSFDYKK